LQMLGLGEIDWTEARHWAEVIVSYLGFEDRISVDEYRMKILESDYTKISVQSLK
jgi:hypothetical protein